MVIIFTEHKYPKATAAQGSIPPVAGYQAGVAVVDGALDGVENLVEEGGDPSVGGEKGRDNNEGVGLSLTIGGTVIVFARLKILRSFIERFIAISRFHAGQGGTSGRRKVSLFMH